MHWHSNTYTRVYNRGPESYRDQDWIEVSE